MNEHPKVVAILALMLAVLALAACGTQTATTPAPESAILLSTPGEISDQATIDIGLTQEKNNADNQAVDTAEIVRGNAQATLDSANATLRAVQTQNQSNSNVISAQLAATAAIVRANAQATLNSAGATRSAALTEDAIRQTQMADQATTNAEAVVNQQNKDELSADTQTAVANNIATQTQVAAATSQWYADQSRQRQEQRAGPISFLWTWCLPVFIVLFAAVGLWGFWRWLKIKQANPIVRENPVTDVQTTNSDDPVHRWLDEVKIKLLNSDKKDEDDNKHN
jgi:hypothetical protein